MKVLYVDYSIGFGGSFKSLALAFTGLPDVEKVLATAQDQSLIEEWFPATRVYGFRRRINYRNKIRFEDRLRDSMFARLGMKLFTAADMASLGLSTIALYRIIKREKVELVHLNNGFIREGASAAWMAKVPYVVHMRGFASPTKSEGETPFRWIVGSRIAASAAALIGVSHAVTETYDDFPGPRCTIYDPVDLDLIGRAATRRHRVRDECKLGSDQVAVGIFGRVTEWKGQREFVNAVIGAMRTNDRIRGVIVGDESDGSPTYFDSLRATIQQSGLADRFVLTGYRANVDDYYAAMDVVVHASIWPEPFGMVVPEAMAAGRPVIAADAGGPHEVVSHDVDGLLVTPGDVPAMEAAIRRLASDGALRQRMGDMGRQKAFAMFGIEAHARALKDVYNRVLPNHALE